MINIDDYKDIYKKFCFHKEEIIKSLLKQGTYPDEGIVKELSANIDYRLALFKSYIFMPGSKVNVKLLNDSLQNINTDLTFLYEILTEVYTNEFSKLNTYVESHLSYLDSLIDKYEKRAKEETNSTTFGRTVYFESNNFDIENHDNQTIIDLGDIELLNGSTIGCFANINNTESKDISFSFESIEEEKKFNTLAYNYNNSKVLVPGELAVNTKDLELSKDFIIKDNVVINTVKVDINNEYKIMGGKDHLLVKNLENMQEYLCEMPTFDTPVRIPFRAHLSFYLIDGSEFEYRFNTRPIHTNFSLNNSTVNIQNHDNYVFMEVPEGFTFALSPLSGTMYAVKENAIIKDNSLYYYGNKDVKTLQVREYVRSNKTKYRCKVYITTEEINNIEIDSIYIKELY